jgi:Rrf2 family protein
VQVTAKVDYALRAVLELAARPTGTATRDELADAQGIPPRYLEMVLTRLRDDGILVSRRGAAGGYQLARAASVITVADVARAVDGPLALVQGQRPEDVSYEGSSQHLHELWIGMRASIRKVMESVTIAHLLDGRLPRPIRTLVDDPDSWQRR